MRASQVFAGGAGGPATRVEVFLAFLFQELSELVLEVVDRGAEVLQGVLGGGLRGVEAGGQVLDTVPQQCEWISAGVPSGLCGPPVESLLVMVGG